MLDVGVLPIPAQNPILGEGRQRGVDGPIQSAITFPSGAGLSSDANTVSTVSVASAGTGVSY
jgi:hypothetical protein